MPRLSKSQEFEKWLQPMQVYCFLVDFGLYDIRASVIAEVKEDAEKAVKQLHPEATEIKIVHVSNRIYVV